MTLAPNLHIGHDTTGIALPVGSAPRLSYWTYYNLESTYRLVPSHLRHRLRILFLCFFGLLGFFTFVLTTGLLYSSLGVGKLVAASIPIVCVNFVLGYSYLRRGLTDVAAPVSRSIVYSSFTAIAAGLYVLAVGVVSQIAVFTKWSPDEVVTLSFAFLTLLLAVLLLLSNRFQRRVRRFIDRNFYVNRYDYRTQWSNVTRSLESAVETGSVLRASQPILQNVFLADEVTIALRDQATLGIRPFLGRGADQKLALALNTRPKVLFLDEPCAGLSPSERQRISKMIAALPRDITLVMIEHDMDVALGLADRVTVLHQGRVILEGTPDEVRANAEVRDVYFGHGEGAS